MKHSKKKQSIKNYFIKALGQNREVSGEKHKKNITTVVDSMLEQLSSSDCTFLHESLKNDKDDVVDSKNFLQFRNKLQKILNKCPFGLELIQSKEQKSFSSTVLLPTATKKAEKKLADNLLFNVDSFFQNKTLKENKDKNQKDESAEQKHEVPIANNSPDDVEGELDEEYQIF